MKYFLFLAFIVMFGVLSAGSTFPLISIEEVEENYLQDYELVKTIKLEGQGHSSAVAKDTGDMVVVTETEGHNILHYIDETGDVKWKKEFERDENLSGYHVRISDNGETVVVHKLNYYDSENTLYDANGAELYTESAGTFHFFLSPDGEYFSKIPFERSPAKKIIEKGKLYSKFGDEILFDLPEDISALACDVIFCDYNKFIASIGYSGSQDTYRIIGYDIEDNSINLIWQRELTTAYIGESLTQFVKSKYGLIVFRDYLEGKLYALDYMGKLLLDYEGICGSFGISQNGNILIDHVKPFELRLIESRSNREHILGVNINPQTKLNFIESCFEISKNVFINVIKGPHALKEERKHRYNSLIFDSKKKEAFSSEFSFSYINNDDDKDFVICIKEYYDSKIYVYREK